MSTASVSPQQKARILSEALPFIRAFHASTLIIRFGGGAMTDPALKQGFARDVALLRLVGMNPIIVHGGGWRIDDLLRTMGIEIRRHSGMRVTDEATLNVVEMVLGEINQELVGLINRFGAKAVGLSGQDGRFIHARRMTPQQVGEGGETADVGLVGEVDSIDPDVVHLLVSRGFIPVIMPIGVGADGTAYHINSDSFAGALARTLHAEKLILMTNVQGIRDRGGRLAFVLTASEAEALLRDGVVPAEMRPRVAAALAAVREGVRSVHIIDGGVESALLLEVLTNSGVGTAMRSDSGPHFLADSRSYFGSGAESSMR
jgi:acetylglutamate kinase